MLPSETATAAAMMTTLMAWVVSFVNKYDQTITYRFDVNDDDDVDNNYEEADNGDAASAAFVVKCGFTENWDKDTFSVTILL